MDPSLSLNVKDLQSVSAPQDDPFDRNMDVRSARVTMFTQPNSLGVLEVGTCGYERRVLVQLRKRWAKFSNVNLRLRRVSLRKASIKAQDRLTGDLVNSNP